MNKLAYFVLTAALFGAGCSSAQTADQSGTAAAPQPQTVVEQPTQVAETNETATESSTYSLDDVSKHATAEDCWIAIEGKVHDVSGFVDNHPGGPAILKGCGKDATSMFKGVEKHGVKASDMLTSLQIGTLEQ